MNDDKKKLKDFLINLAEKEIIDKNSCANLENFCQLQPQQKVVYWGIDCTADSLHVGHLFQLFNGVRFIKEDFELILLLGGATSRIGDPSDKSEERLRLDVENLKKNELCIRKQLERILEKNDDFATVPVSPLEIFYEDRIELLDKIYQVLKISKEDSVDKKWKIYYRYIWPLSKKIKYRILNNKDWIGKLTYLDFLDEVGRKITVNYLLAKDWVQKRLQTGLSYLAFSYSLIQSYDFYYLYKNYNCCGQLGGNDQYGNITTGLKVIRSLIPESQAFAFTFPLLTDSEGKKISKSEKKKKLWLSGDYWDFYDFFRNLSDSEAVKYTKRYTFLSDEQIEKLLALNNPPKLRILQRILFELMWFFNYGFVCESLADLKENKPREVNV